MEKDIEELLMHQIPILNSILYKHNGITDMGFCDDFLYFVEKERISFVFIYFCTSERKHFIDEIFIIVRQ